MEITTKKLLDIISLSILAVSSETDPTSTLHHRPLPNERPMSIVEGEITDIFGDEHDLFTKVEILKLASEINSHLGAIRLGMKLRK